MENQTVNNNDEVEIDLGEVFHLLLSKLGVIVLSGIVFCLAAVMGTMLLITPKYESTTKIVVLSKQDSSTLTNQDIQTSTSLTKDYAELIKSRTVTEGVIAQLKLDMTHEAFRRYTNGYTSSIHHSYRYRSLYSGRDRKRSKRYCFQAYPAGYGYQGSKCGRDSKHPG